MRPQSNLTQQNAAATVKALQERNINVTVVKTGAEARETVLGMLPGGADVAWGTSTTLHQIGLIDALEHGEYRLRHREVTAENDAERRHALRRQASTAHYFLGSVNALAETGEIVCADRSGSRVGGYAYGAGKVILVASAQKIAPDLTGALERLHKVVVPQEDQRIKASGGSGTRIGKLLVIEFEGNPERIHLVLITDEAYGF